MSFWKKMGREIKRPFDQLGREGGRLTNKIKDEMPNWAPDWFKDNAATAINPLAQIAGGDTMGQYYANREAGMDSTDARQKASSNLARQFAMALAAYGGFAALGGAGGGGGAAAGGGAAGGGTAATSGGVTSAGTGIASNYAPAAAGGMNWSSLMQQGLGGMAQGQQQGQQQGGNSVNDYLLMQALMKQNETAIPPQPVWF